MKKLIVTAFIAGIGMATAIGFSQAMPLAPLNETHAGMMIIQVFGGCGWGGHRGPYGHCRPLYNCPPGWHPGPFGRRCFRN
jgi:hypothetical protein